MFPRRYFAGRYFAPEYFPQSQGLPPVFTALGNFFLNIGIFIGL